MAVGTHLAFSHSCDYRKPNLLPLGLFQIELALLLFLSSVINTCLLLFYYKIKLAYNKAGCWNCVHNVAGYDCVAQQRAQDREYGAVRMAQGLAHSFVCAFSLLVLFPLFLQAGLSFTAMVLSDSDSLGLPSPPRARARDSNVDSSWRRLAAEVHGQSLETLHFNNSLVAASFDPPPRPRAPARRLQVDSSDSESRRDHERPQDFVQFPK